MADRQVPSRRAVPRRLSHDPATGAVRDARSTTERSTRSTRLEALGRERDMSMAGVALAWLLADERIAQVVVGPGRPEHLQPVREALQNPLTDEERASLDTIFYCASPDPQPRRRPQGADARGMRRRDGIGARRPRARRGVHAAALGHGPAGRRRVHGADAGLARTAQRPTAFALKAICLIPGNPARGLDAHQGIVTLFDGETGVPTAILDASAVTEIRTAAVTAVATRELAREDARVLAILGAGVQARSHLKALLTVAPVRPRPHLRADRGARPGRRRRGARRPTPS